MPVGSLFSGAHAPIHTASARCWPTVASTRHYAERPMTCPSLSDLQQGVGGSTRLEGQDGRPPRLDGSFGGGGADGANRLRRAQKTWALSAPHAVYSSRRHNLAQSSSRRSVTTAPAGSCRRRLVGGGAGGAGDHRAHRARPTEGPGRLQVINPAQYYMSESACRAGGVFGPRGRLASGGGGAGAGAGSGAKGDQRLYAPVYFALPRPPTVRRVTRWKSARIRGVSRPASAVLRYVEQVRPRPRALSASAWPFAPCIIISRNHQMSAVTLARIPIRPPSPPRSTCGGW
jgi:hypothetical protein